MFISLEVKSGLTVLKPVCIDNHATCSRLGGEPMCETYCVKAFFLRARTSHEARDVSDQGDDLKTN
jgi:hypothetical protein